MNKKFILGLGALATVAAPVAAVISCGGNDDSGKKDNGGGKVAKVYVDLSSGGKTVFHGQFHRDGRVSAPKVGTNFRAKAGDKTYTYTWTAQDNTDMGTKYVNGLKKQVDIVNYLARKLAGENATDDVIKAIFDSFGVTGHHSIAFTSKTLPSGSNIFTVSVTVKDKIMFGLGIKAASIKKGGFTSGIAYKGTIKQFEAAGVKVYIEGGVRKVGTSLPTGATEFTGDDKNKTFVILIREDKALASEFNAETSFFGIDEKHFKGRKFVLSKEAGYKAFFHNLLKSGVKLEDGDYIYVYVNGHRYKHKFSTEEIAGLTGNQANKIGVILSIIFADNVAETAKDQFIEDVTSIITDIDNALPANHKTSPTLVSFINKITKYAKEMLDMAHGTAADFHKIFKDESNIKLPAVGQVFQIVEEDDIHGYVWTEKDNNDAPRATQKELIDYIIGKMSTHTDTVARLKEVVYTNINHHNMKSDTQTS